VAEEQRGKMAQRLNKLQVILHYASNFVLPTSS